MSIYIIYIWCNSELNFTNSRESLFDNCRVGAIQLINYTEKRRRIAYCYQQQQQLAGVVLLLPGSALIKNIAELELADERIPRRFIK
jgi:hypothetical protein